MASKRWRESLWVDLGIGFCGLSAYLPCESRLACLPCPNCIEKREQLPVFEQQLSNLLELRMLGDEVPPAARRDELDGAIPALDRRMDDMEVPAGVDSPDGWAERARADH
jgi:hypothetical protein